MAVDKQMVIRVAFIGVIALFLALPVLLFYVSTSVKVPRRQPDTYAPTPMHPLAGGNESRRVVRTLQSTAVYYWLYGKIVSVDTVTPEGIRFTFTIDGDPYFTRLTAMQANFSGTYRFIRYDKQFGANSEQIGLPEVSAKQMLSEADGLVELRLPFPRLKPEEERIMAALDGTNSGRWSSLPTGSVLTVETVGIIKE